MTGPDLDPARRAARRAHLLAELRRDTARPRASRLALRPALATAAALVVLASAGGALLGHPGTTGRSLVEQAQAAISRPGAIYHAVVEEHVTTGAPTGRGARPRTFALLHELWHDPATGRTRRRLWTLDADGRRSPLQRETVGTPPPAVREEPFSRLDALTALREAYREGRCRCEQPLRTSHAGRPALVLRFERRAVGGSRPRSHVAQTVVLAADTLHPLQVDVRTRDRWFHNDHRLIFRSFEELPSTPATRRLLRPGG